MNLFWWQPFLLQSFSWYAVVLGIGWLAFPMVYRTQRFAPGGGLGMSRIAGLCLWGLGAAWLSWWDFASLFGLRATANFYFALLLPMVGSIIALKSHGREYLDFLKTQWRSLVGIEVAFLTAFVAYLAMRSYCADATWDVAFYGAEKWGNMALLQSLVKHPVIPPLDPWLAGYTLNYYYFSHWIWAGLARLSGTEAPVAFNLGLATIFALLVVQAYGLGRSLSERRAGGWWAVLLVVFAGSPATWSQVSKVLLAADMDGVLAGFRAFSFWWPSDVIPHTRNEFPAFNWVLGDLHAHGFGLLLLMAALSLVLSIFRLREARGGGWYALLMPLRMTWLLLVLLMGAMWATNGWDLAVLGMIVFVWVALDAARSIRAGDRLHDAVSGWLVWGVMALVAILFVAMFYTSQTTMPLQIRHPRLAMLPGPLSALGSLGVVPTLERTRPSEWWMFWGFFAAAGLAALVYHLILHVGSRLREGKFLEIGRFCLPILPLAALVLIWTIHGWNRPGAMLEPLVLAILILGGLVLTSAAGGRLDMRVQASLVFILIALGLQLFAEILFIDDPIGPAPGEPYEPVQRYNTVFKLAYPAWMLFAVGIAGLWADMPVFRFASAAAPEDAESAGEEPAFYPIDASPFDEDAPPRLVIWPTLLLAPLGLALIIASGIFTVLAVGERVARGHERIDQLLEQQIPVRDVLRMARTLDALAFLEMPRYAPSDYQLGQWMREQSGERDAFVVEGSSDSYTMAGRFTVMTGLPNMLGWEGHEVQWRGSLFYDRVWRSRRPWIDSVYTATDPSERASALESLAWSVAPEGGSVPNLYVMWGKMERERYGEPPAELENVAVKWMHIDGAILYRYRMPMISDRSPEDETQPTTFPLSR